MKIFILPSVCGPTEQLRSINESFSLLEQTGDCQKRDAALDCAKPSGSVKTTPGQYSTSAEEEANVLGQRMAQPTSG